MRPGPLHQPSPRPRRRQVIIAVVVVAVLILGVAGAGVSYLLLRTKGSPQQTAASYLAAWQQGSYQAMDRVSVHVPQGGLARPVTRAAAQLGMRRIHLTLGQVTRTGGTAQARFTATASLASGHAWTYQGLLRLVNTHRRWLVDWSPAAIYPRLAAGERFVLTAAWPARAAVLAADGTDLTSPSVTSQSGSIALLTGGIAPATKAQAKQLGAPYQAGDRVGQGGVEQAFQGRLAGRPSLTIRVEGPGHRVDSVAHRFPGSPGKPVRTSLDLHYQLAASQAVAAAPSSKPVDLVAVQPSTGRVLAVAERPGGFDRALQGVFPPGSTFKVVTASALAAKGMQPSSPVRCPPKVVIDGRTFHNFDNEKLGTTSLLNAFAVSCNSTFAMLATQRLTGPALASMAGRYGFNASPRLGIPARLGRFTTPQGQVDLAADAFGQGTDLVNPLSQACAVAAVDAGRWRPPRLVTSPAPHQAVPSRKLSPGVLAALRPMMRAVVTKGTAAHVGFPPGVYGKTGTAEYGSGRNPPTHAWFIGYRGDVAFAVLVEGGGTGADKAGPVAKAFLGKL